VVLGLTGNIVVKGGGENEKKGGKEQVYMGAETPEMGFRPAKIALLFRDQNGFVWVKL